jgi:hypothetical protein
VDPALVLGGNYGTSQRDIPDLRSNRYEDMTEGDAEDGGTGDNEGKPTISSVRAKYAQNFDRVMASANKVAEEAINSTDPASSKCTEAVETCKGLGGSAATSCYIDCLSQDNEYLKNLLPVITVSLSHKNLIISIVRHKVIYG